MELLMNYKIVLLSFALLSLLNGSISASAASVSYTFDYTSTLNQILTSPSTGTGTFTESGQATFSDPTLSATFNATGIFSDYGLTAEFNTFNFRLYQESTLIGVSTTLYNGEAHLTPTPTTIYPLTGAFDVSAGFQPIGPTLSGYRTIDISGSVIAVPGGLPQGRYLAGTHSGTGTVVLQNPEPTTVVLLGSGLAGFGLMQYVRRRKTTSQHQLN
jgi:hypothetical protein